MKISTSPIQKIMVDYTGTGHQRWRWKIHLVRWCPHENLDLVRWFSQERLHIWLVVWNIFLFFHILGTITPTDFHIFQRVETTSQHIGDVPLPCWIPNVAGLGKSETVKDLSLEAGVCLGGWPWFKWGNFLGETEKVTAPILYISYWWLDMVYLCIYNIYCIYIYIMCFNCIYIFINRYTHSYWWWLVRGTTPPLGLFQGSCFLSCLDQAWLSVLTIFQIGFPF